MTNKKKKIAKQQPTEEIQMADNKDIMIITGARMKYLSLKENEYGHNHVFNVLDESPLKELLELRAFSYLRFSYLRKQGLDLEKTVNPLFSYAMCFKISA